MLKRFLLLVLVLAIVGSGCTVDKVGQAVGTVTGVEDCAAEMQMAIQSSFEDSSLGSCPQGWECSGSAQVLTGAHFQCGDGTSEPAKGMRGEKYLSTGCDESTGEAKGPHFVISSGVDRVTFLRAGGSDEDSGLYVVGNDGDVLCSSENGQNTDILFKDSCNGLSQHEGKVVRIVVRDSEMGHYKKVYVDNIQVVSETGMPLPLQCPKVVEIVEETVEIDDEFMEDKIPGDPLIEEDSIVDGCSPACESPTTCVDGSCIIGELPSLPSADDEVSDDIEEEFTALPTVPTTPQLIDDEFEDDDSTISLPSIPKPPGIGTDPDGPTDPVDPTTPKLPSTPEIGVPIVAPETPIEGGIVEGCCVQLEGCFITPEDVCGDEGGKWSLGACSDEHGCKRIFPCLAEEVRSCQFNDFFAGEQVCQSYNHYGSCFPVDNSFAKTVDRDADGDPDLTDCRPDESDIGHNVPEICEDLLDNNCNRVIDEEPCTSSVVARQQGLIGRAYGFGGGITNVGRSISMFIIVFVGGMLLVSFYRTWRKRRR